MVEIKGSLQPRIVNGEAIVVDIQTALHLMNEDSEGSMKVPGISFEVRSAIASIVGVSSDTTGLCEMKGLAIGDGSSNVTEGGKVILSITATYGEGSKSRKVIKDVEVNISEQAAEILRIRSDNEKRALVQRMQKEADARQEAADEQRRSVELAQYEALAPERKRQMKAEITEAGRKIMENENFGIAPFNVLRENAEHPHARETALMIAKKMPGRCIDGVSIFKSTSWAGEVMCIAAKERPEHAISAIEAFEDMRGAQDVLRIAAKRYPKEVIKAFPKFAGNTWCYELMISLAESAPQAVFEAVEMWEYYPWAREVALEAASQAPQFVARNYKLYQHQSWAKEVYEKVTSLDENGSAENAEFQRLLRKEIEDKAGAITNENPRNNENFAFLYEHRHHPLARELMLEACRRSRIVCASAIEIYKSAPWAREVMMDIASDPIYGSEVSLNVVENYMEMPWAEEVMRAAAYNQPATAIRLLNKYAAKPWSKEVMLDIAKKSPAEILSGINFIEFQKWAGDVVIEASKSVSSSEMAVILQKCKFQPWIAPVIREIAARERREQQVLAEERAERERSEQQVRAAQKRREQQALAEERAAQERKARSELAKPRKEDAARLALLRDEEWAQKEEELKKKSRRNFLGKIGGIVVALVGIGVGVARYRIHDEERRSENYQSGQDTEALSWNGVKIWEISESEGKILPGDINSFLTSENINNILETLDIKHSFEKNKTGLYQKDLPEIEPTLANLLKQQFGQCKIPYIIKAERVDDGIVTVGLDVSLDKEKDCSPPLKHFWCREDNWMVIRINMEGVKSNNALEGEIIIRKYDIRPIAETVKFKFKDGLWYLDHTVQIGWLGSDNGPIRVMHDAEGQAAIREERRKKEAEKVLNAK